MSEIMFTPEIEPINERQLDEQKAIERLWEPKNNQLISRGFSTYQDFLAYGPEEADYFSGITKKEFEDLLAAGRVLDVGCGKGRFVSDCLDKGYDAYGVDLAFSDDKAIGRVNEENKRILGRVTAGDARRLPFKDETFELTLNMFGAPSYILDPEMAESILDEQIRILKPGGRIIMLPVDFIDDVPYPANHTLKSDGQEIDSNAEEISQRVEYAFASKLLKMLKEKKIAIDAY